MTTLTLELTREQIIELVEQLPPADRRITFEHLAASEYWSELAGIRLEEYFSFIADDDIRLKGTRIGIESILIEYLQHHKTPEQIAALFTSVALEQVYATILYYLKAKEKVTAYLTDYLNYTNQARQNQAAHPPSATHRIKTLIAQRQKA